MTRLVHQESVWELVPDFEPLLRTLLASKGRIVKESRAKVVTEHQIDGRSYFIKRYRHDAFLFRPLKFFLKQSQAAEEWWLAKKIGRRDIPIVRHVALGQRWSLTGLQESILITEGFDGVPVNECRTIDPSALVAFIENMARRGIVQRDLHPANLLVREIPFEIRLVDLHGTIVLEKNTESERERNRDQMLALLRMTMRIPVSREIESASRQLRKQALGERSKRCLKTNREFSKDVSSGWRWQVRTAAITQDVKAILSDPDAFIERGQMLKQGRSSTVVASGGLVLKRYNFKKPLNAVKDLFRGSRARRGFRKAYQLELCGVATPRVIACADRRILGLPVRSYLLMEEISAAVDAAHWPGEPRAGARALAQLIAGMHAEGFTHRDLKETNILFDASGKPHLIDLDGLTFVGDVPTLEVAANLSRLAEGLRAGAQWNRANLITFLLAYCRSRRMRPRTLFPRSGRS